MEFQHPWLLLTLLAVPLLGYWMYRRPRPTVVIASTIPVKNLKRKRKLTVLELCLLASLALLAFALGRPRTPAGNELIRAKGLDIILAIDLSGSMEAIDRPAGMNGQQFLAALNNGDVSDRLSVAKSEIRKFINARPNDRIGLIGFADMAYSFVPPTLDHALVLERLAMLRTGEIGQRTGIASPVGVAVEKLKNSSAPRRVLVLFTDGANTAQNRLTPRQAAEVAREFNVIIHTVGIGGEDAGVIVDTPFGKRFQPVGDSYDALLLRDIAKSTGGTAFHAADEKGLAKAMKEINSLERTNVEKPRAVRYREYAPWIALAIPVLLLFGMSEEYFWKMRLP